MCFVEQGQKLLTCPNYFDFVIVPVAVASQLMPGDVLPSDKIYAPIDKMPTVIVPRQAQYTDIRIHQANLETVRVGYYRQQID